MATKFFNPTDPFGLTSGASAKWAIQNGNPSTTKDRAQWFQADGDEGGSQLYNTKTTVSATYVATAADAPIPKFGEIKGGYHIDNVAVNFSYTAFVTMTLTGHKHGNTTHPTCKTYTGTLTTVGVLFGCPSSPTGCTVSAGTGVRTVSYTLTGNHIDELTNDGSALLGAENYDGNETVTVGCCDDGTLTAAEGWDATTTGNGEGNTQAETANGTFVKHLAADATT